MLFQIQLKDFLERVRKSGAETVDMEDLGDRFVFYLTIPRHIRIYFTVISKDSDELGDAKLNLFPISITGSRNATDTISLMKLNKQLDELKDKISIENAEPKPSD